MHIACLLVAYVNTIAVQLKCTMQLRRSVHQVLMSTFVSAAAGESPPTGLAFDESELILIVDRCTKLQVLLTQQV